MNSFATNEMKRLNYLTGEIESLYHEAALKLGLTDSAMQILYCFCNSGDPCLLSDICRLSGTSKQTINSALRKLEKAGILYLESYRGRQKKVCLTAQGQALAESTVKQLIEIENHILDSWEEKECEAYLELTERYLTELQREIRTLKPENSAIIENAKYGKE